MSYNIVHCLLLFFYLQFFLNNSLRVSIPVKENVISPKSSKPWVGLTSGFNMYEISTRPWLYELSQKYGKQISLTTVPQQEWQALKDEGINMVWLMGMWELGPYGLNHDKTDPGLLSSYSQTLPDYTMDDIIGSPYAVVNYTTNLNISSGGDNDLLSIKKKLNDLGMGLMLDFVPNHSACDSPYVSSKPDFYVRAPTYDQPPYDSSRYMTNGIAYGWGGWGDAWTDVAQYNYWNQDTIDMRIQEILNVAKFSDGIRFDVAYLCLNDVIQQNWYQELSSWGYSRPSQEFWKTALDTLKAKYPDIITLAEVYNPYESTLQSLGFDYTYDKVLLDDEKSLNLDSIRSRISEPSYYFTQHSYHFLSNHDEDRAVEVFGESWIANAAAFVSYTLPGMRAYWMGQFQGYSAKLDVHLRRETTEPINEYDQDTFYPLLLNITSAPVFQYGTWEYAPVFGSSTSWRLMAWMWTYGSEKRLCVINFSDQQGQGSIIVSNAEPVGGSDSIPLTDLVSGETYNRSVNEMKSTGLYVIVNSWWAQIFQY